MLQFTFEGPHGHTHCFLSLILKSDFLLASGKEKKKNNFVNKLILPQMLPTALFYWFTPDYLCNKKQLHKLQNNLFLFLLKYCVKS